MVHITNELVEKLKLLNGKNVDISVDHKEHGIIFAISTEKFSCHTDSFFLTMDNDVQDCNFELKLPLTKIENVDISDEDIIVFELGDLKYFINGI